MNKREVRQMYYLLLHMKIEPALHRCYGKTVYLKNNSLCYNDSLNRCKIIFDFYDIQPVFKFIKACMMKYSDYTQPLSYYVRNRNDVMHIIEHLGSFVHSKYCSREFNVFLNKRFFTRHPFRYPAQRYHGPILPILSPQKIDGTDLLTDESYQLAKSTSSNQNLIALTFIFIIPLIVLIVSILFCCMCKKLGIDRYSSTDQKQEENYTQEKINLDKVAHSPIHHRRGARRF